MAQTIHILANHLINQIAAGEVIQRPASVVKELLENAIDAGATAIQLIVKDGGHTLIQVVDNGIGMAATDAALCFTRHATSKLTTAAGLQHINTMGFRGEALAAIAAVAHITLRTCLQGASIGTEVRLVGGKAEAATAISGIASGTSLAVKNLFFNLPARRKFLKSPTIELKHITDTFRYLAIGHPHIAFSYTHNGKMIQALPITKGKPQRIAHVLGTQQGNTLMPCQETMGSVTLEGFIGQPAHAKKRKDNQFFFVNNRYVKSHYLHHAIKKAFEGLIGTEVHPAYVCFIKLPPDQVDVNVHPTKTAVKFENESLVYTLVGAAIHKALAMHHLKPALDFVSNVNHNPFDLERLGKQQDEPESLVIPFLQQSQKVQKGLVVEQKNEAHNFETENHARQTPTSIPKTAPPCEPKPQLLMANVNDTQEKNSSYAGFRMQLQQRYILITLKSGLLLIDQHAAHERVLYEKYKQALRNQQGLTQHLLFKETLVLATIDWGWVEQNVSMLEALGFVLKLKEDNVVEIIGHPTDVPTSQVKSLLEALIVQGQLSEAPLTLNNHAAWAKAMARSVAIPAHTPMAPEAIDRLVDELFACDNTLYSPSGDQITLKVDWATIDHWFKHGKPRSGK